MSFYRKILAQSWQTVWSNKYLWFFGLFAAFLTTGGNYKIFVDVLSGNTGGSAFPNLSRIFETGVFGAKTLSNLAIMAKEETVSFLLFILVMIVVLALSLFVVWLAIVSQAALVNNSIKHATGKKTDFSDGIAAGIKKFWPVFGVNVIIKISSCILLVVVGLPIALTSLAPSYKWVFALGNIFYVLAFILFVPTILILILILKYAISYIVIKDFGIIESIKSGWKLFSKNWLVSAEMAITLFVLEVLVGLSVILFTLILAGPLLFLIVGFYKLTSVIGFWFMFSLASVIVLSVIVVSGSLLTAFEIASWSNLFIELNGRGVESKLERLAATLAETKILPQKNK